ncbi:MAG: VRR-NUC domain-containing protein [Halieaceae bacterium]
MMPLSEVELDPLYYLHNFEQLCATVYRQYQDLLQPAELEFYRRFEVAEQSARGLFVRLVSRRGELFRREQLDYPELGVLDDAIDAGAAAALLATEENPDPEALLTLLRKDELLALFGERTPIRASMRKAELVACLQESLDADELLAIWRAARETGAGLLRVEHGPVIELLQLLFFGNRRQSLTEFVLSDLGIARHVAYSLDRQERLFDCREQIDEYLLLGALGDKFYEAVEEDDSSAVSALVEPLLAPGCAPLLERRRDRLRNRVARQLERYSELPPALALYACSQRHPARERRVRIHTALQDFQTALDLCEEIKAAPWCEAEIDFVRRQLPALHKKLGQEYPALARDSFAEERLQLPAAASVERLVAEHYAERWQQVHFVENVVINGSFGLALWEQIFAPVPGAFVNPFQSAPLDMYTGEFYTARRDAIEQRLAELAQSDLRAQLLAAYDHCEGLASHWVNWRYLSREVLAAALECIPREHWLLIWRRILFDPEANRSGCPDLLALDPERGYCLIEVKGPGDQLQLNQRRWLRFFQDNEIPAQVAWVKWTDA